MEKIKHSFTAKVPKLWNTVTFTNRHFLMFIHRFIGTFGNHLFILQDYVIKEFKVKMLVR